MSQLSSIDLEDLGRVCGGLADGYNFVRECKSAGPNVPQMALYTRLTPTGREHAINPNQVLHKGGARKDGFGKESLGDYLSNPQRVSDPDAACPQ